MQLLHDSRAEISPLREAHHLVDGGVEAITGLGINYWKLRTKTNPEMLRLNVVISGSTSAGVKCGSQECFLSVLQSIKIKRRGGFQFRDLIIIVGAV